MANILSDTNWQGTRVYDKDKNDVTKKMQTSLALQNMMQSQEDMNSLMLKQVQVVAIKELSLSQMMGRREY